ncbi:class I tRNA ligase family protein [Vibrio lentus]|nr:class I tRNA ligase family protein [Vibrio lentus]
MLNVAVKLLYYIVEALVRWMAPIMSFTADEIWNEMPGERDTFVFTRRVVRGAYLVLLTMKS